MQLLKTLEERQSRTKDGFVEMSEPMYHWAHDFTVRATGSSILYTGMF